MKNLYIYIYFFFNYENFGKLKGTCWASLSNSHISTKHIIISLHHIRNDNDGLDSGVDMNLDQGLRYVKAKGFKSTP